jgi:Cytochrome c553
VRVAVRRRLAPALLLLAAAAAAAGPVDRTERLAAACNGCHGPEGGGSGAIPTLAGQEAEVLAERLDTWRGVEPAGRDHVMARFARGLTDDDVRALADHYAALAGPDA